MVSTFLENLSYYFRQKVKTFFLLLTMLRGQKDTNFGKKKFPIRRNSIEKKILGQSFLLDGIPCNKFRCLYFRYVFLD